MVMQPPSADDSAGEDRVDRAQLILVGAVAIAIIVLGLVVVFNTVLYTDNVAASGAVSEPTQAMEMNREISLNTKRVTAAVTSADNWTDPDDLRDAVSRNVTAYRAGVSNVTAVSGSVIVSFEALHANTPTGSDVVGAQIRDIGGTFESASALGASKNWTVIDDGAPAYGDFNMTIDTDSLGGATQDEAFRLVWEASGSGDNYVVWIYEGSSGDVTIQTMNNSGDPGMNFGTSTECRLRGSGDASNETVEFDFSNGEIVEHPGCSGQINVSAAIDPDEQRELSIIRGDNASGEYSLVVNDPGKVGTGVQDGTGLVYPIGASNSPYWTYGLWKLEFTMTYETQSTTFTDRYEIEVYNRSR